MLNIYFGDMPEAIYNTAVYFKNTYSDKWITAPLGKEMILDIDKSDVVSASLIESPVLGPISPLQLSGGVKTLLLIANDRKHVFNASTCGDNCAKWILKMAEDRKIVINLRHMMNFGQGEFKIRIMNNNVIAKNMYDLLVNAGELV
ncbi:MAG: DUF4869 domain-containing protein [Lachnospiraceae bacterium]|nr:DUF4869 domain-containing protein [Lachnospiraceae bacterium]